MPNYKADIPIFKSGPCNFIVGTSISSVCQIVIMRVTDFNLYNNQRNRCFYCLRLTKKKTETKKGEGKSIKNS